MSDFRIPELPSDEELGLTEEDLATDEAAGPAPPPATTRTPPPGSPAPPTRPRDTAAAPGPRRPWLGPLTLLALVALVYGTSSSRALPDPLSLDAPDTVFAAQRAMTELAGIARAPHPTGSPEHARVRGVLMERLEALGLEPRLQTTTALRRTGAGVVAATVRNVLARVPGTASTGALLLLAHYDSRALAPGAGDDGTGVATILETVRAIRAGAPLRNDLIVLFTDAEEVGLMGAHAFVREHPWMEDVAVAINVEMRGGGGPSIMFETGTDNGWIIGAMVEGDPAPFSFSLSQEVYRRLPNDTDFTPFREAGVQGLNYAAIGRARVYHQAFDTPANLDARTVQHHGLHLTGMVRELGSRALTDVDAPDLAYFRLPLIGLVRYPPAWGYALAGLLLAAVILVGLLVRRAGGRLTGVATGLGLGLVAVAGSAGAGWALFRWVRRYHPETGALDGAAFHEEHWYVLALVSLGLALTAVLLALARRRFTIAGLALGASILPVIAALFFTFAAPLGAMFFQWPALLMLAGTALVAMGRPGRTGLVSWLLLLPVAAAVLAFWTPVTELIWLALTFAAAPAVGALVGLGLVLLLPLLDTLREPNGWWAPALGVLAALSLTAAGMARAAPDADRPAPSTLIYALDRDSARALWASRDDGGLAWAADRVGPLTGETSLERFGLSAAPYRVATAPVIVTPAPEVTAGADTASGPAAGAGGRRSLAVRIGSSTGAELLVVQLPESADAFLRRVNGIEVPAPDPGSRTAAARPTTLAHYGLPRGNALILELDVGADADSLRLDVIEHHLRPAELVGSGPFLRPPHLAPNNRARSDRAMLRTGVVIRDGVVEVVDPAVAAPVAAPGGVGTVEPDEGGQAQPDSMRTDSVQPDSLGADVPRGARVRGQAV